MIKSKVAPHLRQDIPHLQQKSFYVSPLMVPSCTSSAQKVAQTHACISLPHKQPLPMRGKRPPRQHARFQHHSFSQTSCHISRSSKLLGGRPRSHTATHLNASGTSACTYQSIASRSCRMRYLGQALMVYSFRALEAKKNCSARTNTACGCACSPENTTRPLRLTDLHQNRGSGAKKVPAQVVPPVPAPRVHGRRRRSKEQLAAQRCASQSEAALPAHNAAPKLRRVVLGGEPQGCRPTPAPSPTADTAVHES